MKNSKRQGKARAHRRKQEAALRARQYSPPLITRYVNLATAPPGSVAARMIDPNYWKEIGYTPRWNPFAAINMLIDIPT